MMSAIKGLLSLALIVATSFHLLAQNEFITEWKTDNPGISADNQIYIKTRGEGYDFTIDWGDGTVENNQTGSVSHTYSSPGIYTVKISGDFPRIYFQGTSDQAKIIDIVQWGNIQWASMEDAFSGCNHLTISATDAPDLSNVESMASMFWSATCMNSPINHWDVSHVTDMSSLFAQAELFNQPLDQWDLSQVTTIRAMFNGASSFNQDINDWDVSKVTNMGFVFSEAEAFNQPLNDWEVGAVTAMETMFQQAFSFDQPLNNWDVSKVTSMSLMFGYAGEFNQDLSAWDVSSVTDFSSTFFRASSLDQAFGTWDISNATEMGGIFAETALSVTHYDATLNGWAALTNPPSNITLVSRDLGYCNGATARQTLIDTYGWSFFEDHENCYNDPNLFITLWNTSNSGTSTSDQVTIPTTGTGYNYTVNWGDGTSDTGVTGDITHTYAAPGTYLIGISGDFPRIYFNSGGDKDKIMTVEQWGNIAWTSMERAFSGCTNLKLLATDAPDLSMVTDMSSMLFDCRNFNQPINHWDVSTVTLMESLFERATNNNQPLDNWDVSSVTNMSRMFYQNYFFVQSLNDWNVSAVEDMSHMFDQATRFNQPLNNWNTASLEDMSWMFANTWTFNQSLNDWDLSNVTDISWAFATAQDFNQPVNNWDVSQVTNFSGAFASATKFNQPIDNWDIQNANSMSGMLSRTDFSIEHYDAALMAWAALTTPPENIWLNSNLYYCDGETARQTLIDDHGWIMEFDSKVCRDQASTTAFITKWKTDNPGASDDNQITLPLGGGDYDFTVDWGDGNSDSNVTGDITHTYATAGTYTVSITGIFPRIHFDDAGDKDKILEVMQWGDQAWSSMENAFSGCTKLVISADDAPDLSGVTSLKEIFAGATSMNQNIGHWDVSNIETMDGAFYGASKFNRSLNSWDVSNVTSMRDMFRQAYDFNHPLNSWDVSSVRDMSDMFNNAFNFNQPLDQWDVSQVWGFNSMFNFCFDFNQSLGFWDISSATSMSGILNGTFNLDFENYDATLMGWSSLATPPSNVFLQTDAYYCQASSARQKLIDDYGWNIFDRGQKCIGVEDETVYLVENVPAGTVITTVSPKYEGDNDLTFTLTGNPGGVSVDATSGVVTLTTAEFFPFESNNQPRITVTVSDGDLSDISRITVEIVPAIEPAFDITTTTSQTVAENNSQNQSLTVSGETSIQLLYELEGADQDYFSIDETTGELTFHEQDFENPLDTDQDNVYEVTIVAKDLINEVTEDVQYTVTNVNESPAFHDEVTLTQAENTTDLTLDVTDPEDDDITYSLTAGADMGQFSIDDDTGVLSFSTAPDFENPADADEDNVYEVTVQVSDGVLDADQQFFITVNDVNEAPVLVANAMETITENLTGVATLTASDPDADDLAFTLSEGADKDLFALDESTGVLTFIAAPDFETPEDDNQDNAYEVTVRVSDGELTDDVAMTVTVENENDAPDFTSASETSITENETAVVTLTATDQEADNLTYAITAGADMDLFSVDETTGALSFVEAPNFEAPADDDQDNVYAVTVQVSDGSLMDDLSLQISVDNTNEAPDFTTASALSIAENETDITTLAADDPEADELAFTLTDGADLDLFSVDENTGALTFLIAPDFETPTDDDADQVYEVTVQVSDGSLTDEIALLITVSDANDAPIFTTEAEVAVSENGTDITTLTAGDQDNDNLSFAITHGADMDLFTVDETTGALTFQSAPDFETPADEDQDNGYEVTVQVSDGSLTDDLNMLISISNTNEAPVFTSTTEASVSENETNITTLTVSDPEGDDLSFSITDGADQDLFFVDVLFGTLTFNSAPDAEAPADDDQDNVYEVTVQVSDGTLTDEISLLVTVDDANEAPEITTDAAILIHENATAIVTLTSSDPEEDDRTFSLIDGVDMDLFTVEETSGAIAFLVAPDFEIPQDDDQNNVYEVTVQVSDGELTDDIALLVSVDNVNEAPGFTSAAEVAIQENTTSIITLTANDPEAGDLAFTLSAGADMDLFTVDEASGALTFLAAPDFETPLDGDQDNVYEVTVQVSDGELTDDMAMLIGVENVNETPRFTTQEALSISENTLTVTTLTASNQEAEDLTFTVTGGADMDLFTLNETTGELAFITAANYEGPADDNQDNVYVVNLQVSDGELTDELFLFISIVDTDEAPEIVTATDQSVSENQTEVVNLTAIDPETTDLTFSITEGVDMALFDVNETTGQLTFLAAPDFEAPEDDDQDNVYELTVQVSDGTSTGQADLRITVGNENEAPVFTSATAFPITENETAVTLLTASDPEADDLSFTIMDGADADLFSVDENSGTLSFLNAPDFEAPADNDQDNAYEVTIEVSDGLLTDEISLLVSVGNTNEAPVFATGVEQTLPENQTAVVTLAASDPEANDLLYALSAGADMDLFSVNETTGQLTFIAAPDYEDPADEDSDNVYEVTVQVSDGVLTDNLTLQVSIGNVNEAPVSLTDTEQSIPENQVEAVRLNLDDPEADDLFLTISGGADMDLFFADELNRQIVFLNAPDFEAPEDEDQDNVYEVTVQVSDGVLTNGINLQISITNANEAPEITTSFLLSVAENQTEVVTMRAVDPDADELTYAISAGADMDLFSVDATNGELSFLAAPNFEAPIDDDQDNQYEVTVQVSDGSLTDDLELTISVSNVNEAPTFTSTGEFSTPENTLEVGTLSVTDEDSPTIVTTLSGGPDATHLQWDDDQQLLSFTTAPDFENPQDEGQDNTYEIVLTVSDGDLSTDLTVFITVTDVAETILSVSPLEGITFGPNPVQSTLYVQLPDANRSAVNIEVLDLSGRLLLSAKHTDQLDVDPLPQGTYLLVISTGQHQVTKKFVKSR